MLKPFPHQWSSANWAFAHVARPFFPLMEAVNWTSPSLGASVFFQTKYARSPKFIEHDGDLWHIMMVHESSSRFIANCDNINQQGTFLNLIDININL